jgi:hypothetical protein
MQDQEKQISWGGLQEARIKKTGNYPVDLDVAEKPRISVNSSTPNGAHLYASPHWPVLNGNFGAILNRRGAFAALK